MVDNSSDRAPRLDDLMTQVASELMGVARSDSLAATNGVLDQIIEFFDVNDAFIRKHREDRVSELVTSRPERDEFTDGRLLKEMPFDDYPEVAATEHLKEPFPLYADQSGLLQEQLKAQLDADEFSFAIVPLLQDGQTKGIMSLVRFSNQRYTDDELRTLFAIATLMAQFWSRLEAEKKLARRAYFDELTGLPNRHQLTEVIKDASPTVPHTLIVIDIDNMKAINDGLDYELGDRFLIGFAKRLQAMTRAEATIGRMSGDQFYVFLPEVNETQATLIAERFVEKLKQAIDVGDVNIARSVSVGVATSERGGEDQNLLVEADSALHLAKREGKNSFRLFDNGMRQRTIERYEQEVELRQAIENDEFTLHYQPAYNLVTREIIAVEALLRWNHPTNGLVAAGRFIETAEESGLVVEIGDAVLSMAVSQLGQWQADYPDLEMWVNISPSQLMSRDLPTMVRKLLVEHDVRPSRLGLELTEHTMLDDLQTVTGAVSRLKALGVRLAVDDFGTGYSSMKQLRDLPFDLLKIDMTFVAGLGQSTHDEAIVEAALTLAESFDMATIAEGVETEQQIAELLARGCQQAQGYLLAKPTSADEVEELLNAGLDNTQNLAAARK